MLSMIAGVLICAGVGAGITGCLIAAKEYGPPPELSTWLLVGGTVLVAVGIVLSGRL